jgi:hypothetical protein
LVGTDAQCCAMSPQNTWPTNKRRKRRCDNL